MIEIFYKYLRDDVTEEFKLKEKGNIVTILENEVGAKLTELNFRHQTTTKCFGISLDINNVSSHNKIYNYLKKELSAVDGVLFVSSKRNDNIIYVLHIELKSGSPVLTDIRDKYISSRKNIDHILKNYKMKYILKNTKLSEIKFKHRYLVFAYEVNIRKRNKEIKYKKKIHKYENFFEIKEGYTDERNTKIRVNNKKTIELETLLNDN